VRKTTVIIAALLVLSYLAVAASAANLANPASPTPAARISGGVSYYLGGPTITLDVPGLTNLEIPTMMNRFSGRITYAPVSYVNFGVDAGTIQIDVDRYIPNPAIADTVPMFHGNYGWSVGGHIKLSTPYINDHIGFVGIGNFNYFRSTNTGGAYYGGNEVIAAAGVQFRLPNNNGTISAGPLYHLISGESKPDTARSASIITYSNANNLRLWVAYDFFHKIDGITKNSIPYASLEFTMSPKINGSSRVPVQEFSVSVSLGAVSERLHGADRREVRF
jgi:hypothetical protein